jgi:ribosomal protein S18 acetylase RimI-like enzyme
VDNPRPPELTVRAALDSDLPALDRAIPTGRNDVHRAFLARQEAGDASYVVAWQGPVPVGSGVVRWGGRGPSRDPEISNLHVPGPLHSQGIGTAIVHFAEELVRGRGFARVSIGVGEDNPRAAALYDRLGYRDTGRRWTGSYTYFDPDGVEHEETEHVRVLVRDL